MWSFDLLWSVTTHSSRSIQSTEQYVLRPTSIVPPQTGITHVRHSIAPVTYGDSNPGQGDYWRIRKESRHLIRVHKVPRKTWFNPFTSSKIDGSPFRIEELEDERNTIFKKTGELEEQASKSSTWKFEKKHIKRSLGFEFTGMTIFKIKPEIDLENRYVIPQRLPPEIDHEEFDSDEQNEDDRAMIQRRGDPSSLVEFDLDQHLPDPVDCLLYTSDAADE